MPSPAGVAVYLDPPSVDEAKARAYIRNCEARDTGAVPTYGQSVAATRYDDETGALAEMAFAASIGVELPEELGPDRDIGDVNGWHVRGTRYGNGHLPAHDDDPERWPLVLATVSEGWCTVIGWIFAQDAKRPEWWRSNIRHPCYFVPQSKLHRIDSADPPAYQAPLFELI